ncbi:MAG: tetratricopeptide repeat protein, partial [Cyclobacteriaceae bacterium]|nr:tetratricopeptide repeat protein [Cyclobacteriaceae bacterium]
AWDLLEKAELFQPHDPDIILLKSNILCQQDNFEESINYLEKALPLVDEKDQIFFAMGMTYEDWGKLEEAVEAFKQAISINIDNEDALYELAYCLDITGQLEQSLSYYQKFIDNDPYSDFAWYNMGVVPPIAKQKM